MSDKTIKKGICLNVGNCDKANTKENITIQIGEDFICPDCGGDLVEIKEPPFPPTWLKLVVGGIIVVGIAIATYFLIFAGNDNPKQTEIPEKDPVSVESLSLNQTVLTLKVNENEALTVTVSPDNATNKNVVWSSSDESVATVNNGIITAIKTGKVVITAKSVDDNNKLVQCRVTIDVATSPPSSPVYSFGRYDGKLVNGIPDGQGTMYYTCRVQIAKHDRNTYYAEAGDIFVGTWGNGDIVNGNLYDSNNNQKAAILAGKRPNPYNLKQDKCK